MPHMCFSYPSETGSRGAVPPVRDSKICFSYHADIPLGTVNRDAVELPPESKLCFSYTVGTNCLRY